MSRSEHKLRLEGAPLKLIWISETALRSTYKRAAAHSSRASGVAFVQSTTVGEDASRGCTQHSPMTINRPLQQATRDLDIVLSRLFVVPRGRRKFHLKNYSPRRRFLSGPSTGHKIFFRSIIGQDLTLYEDSICDFRSRHTDFRLTSYQFPQEFPAQNVSARNLRFGCTSAFLPTNKLTASLAVISPGN